MTKVKFNKQLEVYGINGKFMASIEILFNYRSETKEVYNASTHDEEKRIINYHIVCGYIGGEKIESPEFKNKGVVWQYIDEIEQKLILKLHMLANVPQTETLTNLLCKRGFTQSK